MAVTIDGDGVITGLTGAMALPAQSGQSGKYLTTDGANASWGTVAAQTQVSPFVIVSTQADPANDQVYFYDVDVDADGNMYIVGDVYGPSHPAEFGPIISLDKTGAVRWRKRLGSAGTEDMWFREVRVRSGLVFATGTTSTTNHGILACLDAATGAVRWTKDFANEDVRMHAVTDSGHVCVSVRTEPASVNAHVIVLDRAGQLVSNETVTFPAGNTVQSCASSTDSNGTLYVTTQTSGTPYRVVVWRVDPLAVSVSDRYTEVLALSVTGTGTHRSRVFSDAAGGLYIADVNSSSRVRVSKFTESGAIIWSRLLPVDASITHMAGADTTGFWFSMMNGTTLTYTHLDGAGLPDSSIEFDAYAELAHTTVEAATRRYFRVVNGRLISTFDVGTLGATGWSGGLLVFDITQRNAALECSLTSNYFMVAATDGVSPVALTTTAKPTIEASGATWGAGTLASPTDSTLAWADLTTEVPLTAPTPWV